MNHVALIGRITRNLTLRTTNNGKSFVFFSVAVNEGRDRTDFINCVAWNKVAENMAKFVGKGSLISVVGKVATRKDNRDQYITEVIANSVTFLDNPKRDFNTFDNDTTMNVKSESKEVNIDNAFKINDDYDTEISFVNNNSLNNSDDSADDDEAIIWD